MNKIKLYATVLISSFWHKGQTNLKPGTWKGIGELSATSVSPILFVER